MLLFKVLVIKIDLASRFSLLVVFVIFITTVVRLQMK
jgi:hypothetical protein